MPKAVTISSLTVTVEAYFAMPTSSAEREAELIVESVRHAFFDVSNLQGIGFLDSSGRRIMASSNRAADITLYSFRSTVLTIAINQRFLSSTLSLDFSLRLPQSIMSTVSDPSPTLASNIHTSPITSESTMVQTPASRSTSAFAFNNTTDDAVASIYS